MLPCIEKYSKQETLFIPQLEVNQSIRSLSALLHQWKTAVNTGNVAT